MHIPLDRRHRTPIYLQIKQHLERLILKGTLPPGYKLAASRELARSLGLNRGTVINAYAELEAEGLVHSHTGQGTFVSEGTQEEGRTLFPPTRQRAPRSKVWQGAFARRMGLMTNREEAAFQSVNVSSAAISFASGVPDPTLFPVREFGLAVTATLRKHGGDLLQYGSAQGYFPLRQWVSARLTRFGIEAEPDEVIIVNGSQQGLDLVGRVLVDPEDRVVVENPTYFGALNAFDAYQATYLGVHRDTQGLDLRGLENILAQHHPKFFYVIPDFHYPTSGSLEVRARRQLVDLLERYQTPFVEDDFCANLRYEGSVEPALKSLDKHNLGIYLGTFSKTLFPGIRIGWIVAPHEVIEPLVAAKQACDLRRGDLAQAAVYEFCQRGAYDRHLKAVRETYRHRRDVALDALARFLPPDCRWEKPAGGLSIWLTLPGDIDARELLGETAAGGVLFAPGTLFSPFGGGRSSMRLCFASLEPEAIEKGIAVIGKAVRKRLGRSRRAPRVGAREAVALP